jgi:excisionase family DNA binding protein
MKHFLNAVEAANLMQISMSKLYKLTASKMINYYKCGNKLFFLEKDLQEWLDKNMIPVKSADEIEKIAAQKAGELFNEK